MNYRELLRKYRHSVLSQTDRLLSLIDRRKDSPTYGCCRPAHWREKKPSTGARGADGLSSTCASWQVAGSALALLYELDLPDNPIYRREKALEWIRATVRHWAEQLLADQEPTDGLNPALSKAHAKLDPVLLAPSTAALAQTFRQTIPFLTGEEKQLCLPLFRDIGDRLAAPSTQQTALSQAAEAAVVDALYAIHCLLPQASFQAAAQEKMQQLAERQCDEGWLAEGGGPDLAAATEALHHLAVYLDASGDAQAEQVIERVLDYVRYFIYPDGVSGGGGNRRFASGLTPSGFAILQRTFPLARALTPLVLRAHGEGFFQDLQLGEGNSLAAYFNHQLTALNYLEEDAPADVHAQHFIPADSPSSLDRHFPQACILVEKRSNYYAICGPGGQLGAVFSFRSNSTQLLSSPCSLSALSGLKIISTDGICWTSLELEEQERELSNHTLNCTSEIAPQALGELINGAEPPADSPASSLPRWLPRWPIFGKKQPAPPSPPENAPASDDLSLAKAQEAGEHFVLKRRLEFREGAIAVTNVVTQKTRDRDFQLAALCEPLYAPPYRQAEKYRIVTDSGSFAPAELREQSQIQTAIVQIAYNGLLELCLELDGARPLAVRWLTPTNSSASPWPRLCGHCLQLEIDIDEELKKNWKAQVNYVINFQQGGTTLEENEQLPGQLNSP